MANRQYDQFQYSAVKGVVTLYADVKFAAGNTCSLVAHYPGSNGKDSPATAGAKGYQGIASVTQSIAGVLTINLQDSYYRLLDYNVVWQGASASLASGSALTWLSASNVSSGSATAGGNVLIGMANTGSVLAAPSSGSECLISLTLANKSN